MTSRPPTGAPSEGAPVSFPPDPNPKKPRLRMPPGAWDTHFHIVGPPHVFPYTEKRWHTPPAAPVEHYLAVAKVLGFERGCVVQPSAHGSDPAVTLDAIKKSEGRLCGMIRADPGLEDSDIRKLHAAGVRGVRIELRAERRGASGHGTEQDPESRTVRSRANASIESWRRPLDSTGWSRYISIRLLSSV